MEIEGQESYGPNTAILYPLYHRYSIIFLLPTLKLSIYKIHYWLQCITEQNDSILLHPILFADW